VLTGRVAVKFLVQRNGEVESMSEESDECETDPVVQETHQNGESERDPEVDAEHVDVLFEVGELL
jgi:hypothetical protein